MNFGSSDTQLANTNPIPPSRIEAEAETEIHSSGATQASLKTLSIQEILQKTFKTIMNTVVTIFSMGVGVGMILGDSLHQRSSHTTESSQGNITSTSSSGGDVNVSVNASQHDNIDGQTSEESDIAMASTASLHSSSYSNLLPAQ